MDQRPLLGFRHVNSCVHRLPACNSTEVGLNLSELILNFHRNKLQVKQTHLRLSTSAHSSTVTAATRTHPLTPACNVNSESGDGSTPLASKRSFKSSISCAIAGAPSQATQERKSTCVPSASLTLSALTSCRRIKKLEQFGLHAQSNLWQVTSKRLLVELRHSTTSAQASVTRNGKHDAESTLWRCTDGFGRCYVT